MKTNLTLLLLLVMMVSCQPKKSDSTEMSVAEAAKIDNIEDCAADTVKATAMCSPENNLCSFAAYGEC